MDKRQKKHKSKDVSKDGTVPFPKRPILTLRKRNELSGLVKTLLEIVIRSTTNPKEEWQQFVDSQALLKRIQVLEAPLRRQTKNASQAARMANIEAFYQWASENDIEYKGVKISQFAGYDLGLEATRDIAKDEQIFVIPREVILSEEYIEEDFKLAHFGSMTNLKLAYALMIESLKPDSFWKPYIDLLPESYDTVLYFSIDEMSHLQGSNALSNALRQCRAIVRQYAFIYNCTQQAPRLTKMSQIGQAFREQFSYGLYRWAVSSVMTRENMIPRCVVPDNGEKPEQIAALIPFWDMANHRHGIVSSYYNGETHNLESDAQMEFKQGEQIFIHYGDRSNAELMIHNGFVNPTNPKDYVNIRLGLNTADPLFEKRTELLQQLEIQKNCELKVLPGPEHISPQLLAFVRVFNMNADQLEHWITSERAQDLAHIDCALETSLETKTWEYLKVRLMLLLRFFPTTLEEDEKLLAEHRDGVRKLTYRAGMALQYRLLEKRILCGALDYVKQRSKP